MTQNVQNDREAVQTMLQSYLLLFSQQRWDEWIDLWADDGVLEFPFAPAGRRRRYVGKTDILAYMKSVASRMASRIKTEGVDYFRAHPMLDAAMSGLEMRVKGRILETGAPYEQTYISIIKTQGGKLSLFREYWNPIVSMDAHGGREAWTAAFGSPDQPEAAS